MRVGITGNVDTGFTVKGYLKDEQWGETQVISLFVKRQEVKVAMSRTLPQKYGAAMELLECFKETLTDAEALRKSVAWRPHT